MLEFIVLGLIPGTNIQLTFIEILLFYLVICVALWLALKNNYIIRVLHASQKKVSDYLPIIAANLTTTLLRLV